MKSMNFSDITTPSKVPLSESGLVRGLFIKYDPYKYSMILEINKKFSSTQTNLSNIFTFKNPNPSEAKYSNIGFANWQKDSIFL